MKSRTWIFTGVHKIFIFLVLASSPILAAFGSSPEVIHVRDYIYPANKAADLCEFLGATLATKAQLQAAFEDGASWCDWGWTEDGNNVHAYYPNTMDVVYPNSANPSNNCGDLGKLHGPRSQHEAAKNKLGLNCWGIKPERSHVQGWKYYDWEASITWRGQFVLMPFNRFLWSSHDRTNNNTRLQLL